MKMSLIFDRGKIESFKIFQKSKNQSLIMGLIIALYIAIHSFKTEIAKFLDS